MNKKLLQVKYDKREREPSKLAARLLLLLERQKNWRVKFLPGVDDVAEIERASADR